MEYILGINNADVFSSITLFNATTQYSQKRKEKTQMMYWNGLVIVYLCAVSKLKVYTPSMV